MTSGKNAVRGIFRLFLVLGILANAVGPVRYAADRADAASSHPSNWTVSELMMLIAQHKSHEVHFEETMFSDMLSEPLKSSGTLRFTPPSKLEKHVIQPADERYVIEGNHVLFEEARHGDAQRLSLDEYPSLRGFVEAFRASLSGDAAALTRYYSTDLKGDRRQWQLTLRPVDQSVQALIREIHLTGAEGWITGMTLYAANGDRSVLVLSRKQP